MPNQILNQDVRRRKERERRKKENQENSNAQGSGHRFLSSRAQVLVSPLSVVATDSVAGITCAALSKVRLPPKKTTEDKKKETHAQ